MAAHLIAAALPPQSARGELVAAGVDPVPAAATSHMAGGADAARQPIATAGGSDPATELACAAMLYLIRKPDTEAARRRLRAAVEALPLPPLGVPGVSMTGPLLDFRIAAEMTLRASRTAAGMRCAEPVLRRTLDLHCRAVRRALEGDGATEDAEAMS